RPRSRRTGPPDLRFGARGAAVVPHLRPPGRRPRGRRARAPVAGHPPRCPGRVADREGWTGRGGGHSTSGVGTPTRSRHSEPAMSTPHCPRRARRARLAALALAVALPAAACTDPNWSPNLDRPFDAMGDDGQVPARGEGEHAEVPSAPGTVRGWVTFGHPVEAATVVVLGEDGEQVGSEATTDELGYFETDAPYGPDYTVVATG